MIGGRYHFDAFKVLMNNTCVFPLERHGSTETLGGKSPLIFAVLGGPVVGLVQFEHRITELGFAEKE